MNIEMTPAEASRFLREAQTTVPSRGADYWAALMNQGRWEPTGFQAPVGPLRSGQHRLNAFLRNDPGVTRRRRIVRVATLKYRARKRRR